MKLTRQMIEEGKSDRGGWNAQQLAVLGVSWPPKQGWPTRIIGKEISEKAFEDFIALGQQSRKKKRAPKNHPELFDLSPARKNFGNDAESFATSLYESSNRNLA